MCGMATPGALAIRRAPGRPNFQVNIVSSQDKKFPGTEVSATLPDRGGVCLAVGDFLAGIGTSKITDLAVGYLLRKFRSASITPRTAANLSPWAGHLAGLKDDHVLIDGLQYRVGESGAAV